MRCGERKLWEGRLAWEGEEAWLIKLAALGNWPLEARPGVQSVGQRQST